MRELSRWPVLLVGAVLLAGAVTLDAVQGRDVVSAALLCLSSACVGAFLYAEGVRSRDPDDSAAHGSDHPDDAASDDR